MASAEKGPACPITDFFKTERRDWLKIKPVPSDHGGWDVAVIIDGSYAERADASSVAAYMAERFAELLNGRHA